MSKRGKRKRKIKGKRKRKRIVPEGLGSWLVRSYIEYELEGI